VLKKLGAPQAGDLAEALFGAAGLKVTVE